MRGNANVAGHLTDDGSFEVEVHVSAFRLRNDQNGDAEAIWVDEVRLDVLRHDMTTQMIEASLLLLDCMPGRRSATCSAKRFNSRESYTTSECVPYK